MAAAALLGCVLVPVFGQQRQNLPGVVSGVLDVRVVNVEVVVVDRAGQRVTGLAVEDFELIVDGSVTPIEFFTEVQDGMAVAAEAGGVDVRDWIVTGFSDYRGEDGLYRKYGAFNVSGQIIPRHMIFSHDWLVKRSSRKLAGPTLKEEREYIEANPHSAELREIFATAQIDYGRIDYTVHDDHIRVFEINTNPQILTPGPSNDAARNAVKARFAERFVTALEMCNSPAPDDTTVPVHVPYTPVRARGVSMVERTISLTNAIGLERFEPQIFRRLFAIRVFCRTNWQKLWAHTPLRVRHAIRQLRHG